MSDGPASNRALEALRAVRAEKFEDVPVEVLEQVYGIEQSAQFESDRRPTIAKLRDLIVNRDDS